MGHLRQEQHFQCAGHEGTEGYTGKQRHFNLGVAEVFRNCNHDVFQRGVTVGHIQACQDMVEFDGS